MTDKKKGFLGWLGDLLRPAPYVPAPPRIGRVVIHSIRCTACSKPLEHGDLVVTVDGELTTGERFPYTGHAACMVLVRKPDGTFKGTLHKYNVVLGEADWESWKATEARGEATGGELRIIGFNEHGLSRFVRSRG